MLDYDEVLSTDFGVRIYALDYTSWSVMITNMVCHGLDKWTWVYRVTGDEKAHHSFFAFKTAEEAMENFESSYGLGRT